MAAIIISTLGESCALRLLSATCCVFCVMKKPYGLYYLGIRCFSAFTHKLPRTALFSASAG